MYQMGLYLLPEGTHADFDKELSRFFWSARDGHQKYHMVKWADVCAPKSLGGIGILDSRRFNVALMLKWVWRILRDDGGLWLQLIKAKYLRGRPLLACERREGSQFWRALQEIKHFIGLGLSFELLRDRLPSGVEVAKRNGPGNGLCPLCGTPETCAHIMFSCSAAQALWGFVSEALGPAWEVQELGEFLQSQANRAGGGRRLFWLVFAAISWSLWNVRNKMVFEKVYPSRVSDPVFSFLAFLQQWSPLVRQRDRAAFDSSMRALRTAAIPLAAPAPPGSAS
uniref:Uncharacterized protein n=1 Tax=Avena sativa TaxID=4498 RepID=A0ACD5TC59_AVESA